MSDKGKIVWTALCILNIFQISNLLLFYWSKYCCVKEKYFFDILKLLHLYEYIKSIFIFEEWEICNVKYKISYALKQVTLWKYFVFANPLRIIESFKQDSNRITFEIQSVLQKVFIFYGFKWYSPKYQIICFPLKKF